VSRTVVSFVLNNRPHSGIPEATRQRVLQAAAELGYRPNRAARALASGRSRQLAVLVGETRNDAFGDAFLPSLLRGIDAASREGGYRILFEYLDEATEQQALTSFRESTSDGMLVWAPGQPSSVLDEFIREGAAVMVIGDPGTAPCPSVDIDNLASARAAVEHLLGHGYRDIAMITNVPLSYASSQARRAGFVAALEAAEIRPNAERIIPGELDEESGRRAMEKILSWRPLPRAVFAASDQVAIGALGALQRAGVRVPEEVALVGFDDIPLAASVHPTLSTVRVPASELGRLATRRLVDLVEGRPIEPPRMILPTSLIARRSCGCAAPTDP
jgi:LacI family transcriptional regulator